MNQEESDNKAIQLIKDDESHRKYFFNRVSNPKWYFKLKGEGFFEVSNVPNKKVHESGGVSFPSWLPFYYFQKLIPKLDLDEHDAIISDLVQLIYEIGQQEIDNPYVWWDYLKTLVLLPNDKIPKELLYKANNWVNSEYEISLPSNEIIGVLLPKFLNDQSSEHDLEKSEILLNSVLTLHEASKKSEFSLYDKNYNLAIDGYWLKHTLVEKGIIQSIGEQLSSQIFIKLADNLKQILYGENLDRNLGRDFYISFTLEENSLIVRYANEISEDLEIDFSCKLEDFQSRSVSGLVGELHKALLEKDIEMNASDIEPFIERFFTDFSSIWCSSVHKMKANEIMRTEVKMIHVYLLRELLLIKSQERPQEFIEFYDRLRNLEYRQPIFKRILLYVISNEWSTYKNLFWENFETGFFSLKDYNTNKEIFFLLNENQNALTYEENKKLKAIIDQAEEEKEGKEYEKLRWYTALKDNDHFREEYEALSKTLKTTFDEYATEGEVKTRIGSISPFKVDEIIEMGIPRLVNEIREFKSDYSIDAPSMDGFGDLISAAISKRPDKFEADINLFQTLPHFATYYLIRGFNQAWETKKDIEWDTVLEYILTYIGTENFSDPDRNLEYDIREIGPDLVNREIGRLITNGTKDDNFSFDPAYLGKAKEILSILVRKIERVDDYAISSFNSPTYSLNSTAGILLTALINYSLRYGRINYDTESNDVKWTDEVKGLYESMINKKVIDSFILIGFNYRQFNYIDSEWLDVKVQEFKSLEDEYWNAFMGGFLFNHAWNNETIYNQMYDHYLRGIEIGEPFSNSYDQKITNHLGLFYLWGLDSFGEKSLLVKLIEHGDPFHLESLGRFFWQIRDQIDPDWLKEFRPRLIVLWESIIERVSALNEDDRAKVLSNLSLLSVYLAEISESNIELLKAVTPYVHKNFNAPFFIENLNRLLETSEFEETSKAIGEILLTMLEKFTPDYKVEHIQNLVRSVYRFKENPEIKALADKICVEYEKRNYDFLRQVYKENT